MSPTTEELINFLDVSTFPFGFTQAAIYFDHSNSTRCSCYPCLCPATCPCCPCLSCSCPATCCCRSLLDPSETQLTQRGKRRVCEALRESSFRPDSKKSLIWLESHSELGKEDYRKIRKVFMEKWACCFSKAERALTYRLLVGGKMFGG